jgi:hypothetical protein
MRIRFAHIRVTPDSGRAIDFALFYARSLSGFDEDNAALLDRLTIKARLLGLNVDQSALAYLENGENRFFGHEELVQFLSQAGVPAWTHWVDE